MKSPNKSKFDLKPILVGFLILGLFPIISFANYKDSSENQLSQLKIVAANTVPNTPGGSVGGAPAQGSNTNRLGGSNNVNNSGVIGPENGTINNVPLYNNATPNNPTPNNRTTINPPYHIGGPYQPNTAPNSTNTNSSSTSY